MFAERDSSEDEEGSLFTRRLRFMTPAPGDADELTALADNPRIAANLSMMPHPYRRADAEAWIAQCATLGEGAAAFLVREHGGRLVGGVGYGLRDDNGEPDIGSWIGEPFWGQGYGTEAAQGLIDHVFLMRRPRAVWAACRPTNAAARRVMARCGFQWAGNGLKRSRALGGMISVEHYRLDIECWRAIKAWGRYSWRIESRRGDATAIRETGERP